MCSLGGGGTHEAIKYLDIPMVERLICFAQGYFYKAIALSHCFLDLWPYIMLKYIGFGTILHVD